MQYSDFEEQFELFITEALSELAHRGQTDYFYNQLSDFVEVALRERGNINAEIRAQDEMKILMDSVYSLDVTRIEGWEEFARDYKHAAKAVLKRDHRRPPKPKWYHIAQPGQCKFCGEMVTNPDGRVNRRANWHKPCLAQYKLVYWPDVTKRAVWRRDRGVCCECGEVTDSWEMDHRRPLIESQGDIVFWTLGNCTTLCYPCHKAKTGREATERATARRAAKTPPPLKD